MKHPESHLHRLDVCCVVVPREISQRCLTNVLVYKLADTETWRNYTWCFRRCCLNTLKIATVTQNIGPRSRFFTVSKPRIELRESAEIKKAVTRKWQEIFQVESTIAMKQEQTWRFTIGANSIRHIGLKMFWELFLSGYTFGATSIRTLVNKT